VDFPEKGISEVEFNKRLQRAYEESFLHTPQKSLVADGPHMLGDRRRQLALEAYMRFVDANTPFETGAGARNLEREAISMVGSLLGNRDAVGNVTAGGTESNLLAMIAARKRAGYRGSVVLSTTAHPSLWKACEYFGLEAVPVECKPDWTADVEQTRKAIRKDTIAIVGTAGTWPFATIDPIEELGEIAEENDLYFHIDAAIGGLLLPFLERAGERLPKYDFRVKSVCSISTDPHKSGLAPFSAGSILFRDEELHNFARFKFNWKTRMAMASYQTDTVIGSRPGSGIVGAWSMFNLFGVEGYITLAKQMMRLTYEMRDGLKQIPGLKLLSPEPKVNLASAYSDEYDLQKVADELFERKGWIFYYTEKPAGFVFILDPLHDGQVEPFLADLRQAMRLKVPI
jgi:glutamate/tyrosine decarboxylase-like PLP-dependent enzyme